MSDCLFCDIVAGAAPASVVRETDRILAFLDIRPVAPGHTLVVPKPHADGLGDLAPDDAAAMMKVATYVAEACREAAAVDAEGINLFLADGAVAGQEVLHAHLHVVPRFADDDVGFRWRRRSPGRAELDAIAEALAERV
jgi:diadenosine tetraphosphate (Ap4A) HIT family hydrolase